MSQQRASAWSVTINNPTPADEEQIALARQKGWKVEGQLERGEQGTPHYQLLVKTGQVRFSALKNQFPRAHIEVARNVTALQTYVHKEETREGELNTSNEMYPSLSKLFILFWDYIDSRKMYDYDDWSQDDWLCKFDKACEYLIYEGYHIESMAVNPATRSIIKKFGRAIIMRARDEQMSALNHADIDRQTDTETQSGSNLNSRRSSINTDATDA